MPKRAIPREHLEQIFKLRRAGRSYREIEAATGYNFSVCAYYCKKEGLPNRQTNTSPFTLGQRITVLERDICRLSKALESALIALSVVIAALPEPDTTECPAPDFPSTSLRSVTDVRRRHTKLSG